MGFWPFGGAGGKRLRATEPDEHVRETLLRRTPSDSMSRREKDGAVSTPERTENKNRSDDKSRRLSKQRIAGSKDSTYSQPARSQTAPIMSTENLSQRASKTAQQNNEKRLYQQDPLSQSSLQPENFTVIKSPPTLHAKRTENESNVPRRKSSKRKAEDYAREREIKAMSSPPIPIPKRPATLYGTGPLQRDTRQIPGGLNRRLERPMSDISLPIPGSLPDVGDMPHQNSFKVGMLAALSPRPTVRYDKNPRTLSGKQTVRSNRTIRQAIEEDDLSDKKRIDELADELDAGGLRELMERDRRRRERKRESEKAKLQRKLQRRAEKQREEEARRARTEAFVRESPTATERGGDAGVEASLLSPQTLSEQAQSRMRAPVDSEDPFSERAQPPTVPSAIRNPFEDENDMEHMQSPQDSDDEQEDTAPTRSPLRVVEQSHVQPEPKLSQASLSPPVSPVHRAVDRSSMSQGSMMLGREVTPDIPEHEQASDQGSQRINSWTTFFKRGSRRKYTAPAQGRVTPSEFSNTSRESFSRKQPPAPVPPRTFRRSDAATPQRTMSRFREDLPELPISPPDSRVQSPEAGVIPFDSVAQRARRAIDTPDSPANPEVIPGTDVRPGDRLQQGLSLDQKQSMDMELTYPGSTGVILSQSMASVDSEGSWLSGRPSKRLSGPAAQALKQSRSSLHRTMPGALAQSNEDLAGDIPSPASQDPAESPPQQDETWHAGLDRQPTVIKQAGRIKSREGLVNEYLPARSGKSGKSSTSASEAESPGVESPDPELRDAPLLRAQSVEYKGHVRRISAGSAKLLDIRSSVHSDVNTPRSPTASRFRVDQHGEAATPSAS